jgi:hypothetical protein
MDASYPDPRYANLTPELLTSISADEIGGAVVQHVELRISAAGGDVPTVLELLPAGTRAVYTTWVVDAEVNNGGFNQLFFNRDAHFAGYALSGYELMDAEEYAAVMRAAIATHEAERERMRPYYESHTLEAFSESYNHTELGEVDQRYYALGDRIYNVWAGFARARHELFR